MKAKLKVLPWLLPAVALVVSGVLLGFSKRHVAKLPTARVDIQIDKQEDNFFLDLEGVKQLIGANEAVTSLRRSDVALARMERRLRGTGYVEQVSASYQREGRLVLQVQLRRPIVRILDDQSGTSWYVDKDGHRIRRNMQFTARVPVVRGRFDEPSTFSAIIAAANSDTLRDSTLRSLMPLFRQIDSDPFYRAFIAEITVADGGQMTWYPQLGQAVIGFGTVQHADQKMASLKTFCQQVLPRVGWDHYRRITLHYNGQLVAERNS